MKIGLGLPSYLGTAVEPGGTIEWARRADAAGFHALAAHDRPAHDAWEPLATLAAVAGITTRARLVTTILILPAREEGLVAKQAGMVDQLSGGRLDLGVAPGLRPRDYEALGRPFPGRGRRFETQLRRLAELFAAAAERGDDGSFAGTPPVQRPHPPILVGGYTPAAIERAASLGDGYLFGGAGMASMRERIPHIRDAFRAAGRPDLPIGGLAYVAATADRHRLEQAQANLLHYYGTLRKPFGEMVHSGDGDTLRDVVDGYREAGVDVLYLFPTLTELDQVDALAALLR